MENTPMVDEVIAPKKNVLFEVTTVSKFLAAVLFITLPFLGGWIGYTYGKFNSAREINIHTESNTTPQIVPIAPTTPITDVQTETTENTNSQEVIAQDNMCVVDSDCALFSPDCEDCKFEAVNKNQLTEISAQKKLECSKNPPKVMCDLMFTGEVKCLEAKCALVP